MISSFGKCKKRRSNGVILLRLEIESFTPMTATNYYAMCVGKLRANSGHLSRYGNGWHCVFLQHTDSELWSVLDRCHLDRAIRKLGRFLSCLVVVNVHKDLFFFFISGSSAILLPTLIIHVKLPVLILYLRSGINTLACLFSSQSALNNEIQ